MKISIVGTGYVGLVTGACLSEVGNDVLCLDLSESKIAGLNAGEIPIHEPGLEEIVKRNSQAGRLRFTTSIAEAAEFGDIQFIAVGTPPGEDGSADLQHVVEAARNIGRHAKRDTVVVVKSTVPVGTSTLVQSALEEERAKRDSPIVFHIASNPEFLKEGAAVQDFMSPDRIVVGTSSEVAKQAMEHVYAAFTLKRHRVIFMDIRSAELTKYASNAMLATRISFMNELSRYADTVGADISLIRQGMGTDPRIGMDFLYAGCGYGGSCFPKDVTALVRSAENNGVNLSVLRAVEETNAIQKNLLVKKIEQRFGKDLHGLKIAIWGLAFKPETDDMREAPSIVIIEALTNMGAKIVAYDPVAMKEAMKGPLGSNPSVHFKPTGMDCVRSADVLVIVTEWKEFRSPDFERIRDTMRTPCVFDGRNLYDPAMVRGYDIEYFSIGRP